MANISNKIIANGTVFLLVYLRAAIRIKLKLPIASATLIIFCHGNPKSSILVVPEI